MKDFPDLFAEFANARGYHLRENTIVWYYNMVCPYYKWVQVQPDEPDWTLVTTIESYLTDCKKRGLADATIASIRRGLSGFFAWLCDRQYLSANPVLATVKPSKHRKMKTIITYPEFKRFFDSIPSDDWVGLRDRCILEILFFSGLRAGEVLRLKREHMDLQELVIFVEDGKGGHDRLVACSPKLPELMHEYLKLRPRWNDSTLFLSADGQKNIRGYMTLSGLRQMLIRRADFAVLPYRCPKTYRHSYATNFLGVGVRLSSLSKMMGHVDERTTRIYGDHLIEDLVEEYVNAYYALLHKQPRRKMH